MTTPTPGQAIAVTLRETAIADFGLSAADFADWDEMPQWQRDRLEEAGKAAIAAAELTWDADLAAERDELRELLDEIGVTAANAPEDGDSFGLLEQIAMRIAAAGVPDSTPIGEWPDPANPVTGRTPGASAAPGPDTARALDIARDEISALRSLAADILGEFKAGGDGHRARVGQVGYARWVERAGLGG